MGSPGMCTGTYRIPGKGKNVAFSFSVTKDSLEQFQHSSFGIESQKQNDKQVLGSSIVTKVKLPQKQQKALQRMQQWFYTYMGGYLKFAWTARQVFMSTRIVLRMFEPQTYFWCQESWRTRFRRIEISLHWFQQRGPMTNLPCCVNSDFQCCTVQAKRAAETFLFRCTWGLKNISSGCCVFTVDDSGLKSKQINGGSDQSGFTWCRHSVLN